MTFVEPLDARTFSRALWKAMTECVVVFPEGVGVVPWMVPGGQRDREGHVGADEELSCGHLGAARSVRFRRRFRRDLRTHALYRKGSGHLLPRSHEEWRLERFLNTITDEGLAQIGVEFNVEINKEFLDVQ